MNKNIKFLAIVIDPPQKRTGCKFTYNTQSNKFIFESIPFELLQSEGYVFLWVTNGQIEEAMKIMGTKGYEKCEILVWIILNEDKTLYNNIGYYLRHVAEFCVIFRKKGPFKLLKSRSVLHFHSNILSKKSRKSCQKPEIFYQLVEEMVPDHQYLDIFARECNQRDKWFSVGDQSIKMPEELRN